jgi:hypothetical protein
MVLEKLLEALAAIPAQRRALDEVEADIRSMIAKLSGSPSAKSAVSHAAPERTVSRVISRGERDKLDDIADVLRAEGRPLHITAIAERLSAIYGKKVDRTTIEPGINRHIQKVKARRIEKFAPSTFGLPEWKSEQPKLAYTA